MFRIFSTLRDAVTQIGADPNDAEGIRVLKTILVFGSLLIIIAAAFYGAVFIRFGEMMPGLLSLGYSAVTLISLVFFHLSRRYRWFLFSQLALGMLIPFSQMLLLGGFWNSSAVMVWSMMVPIAALLFYGWKKARFWWLAYLGLLILGALLQAEIQHETSLPINVVRAFFVVNIATVSGIFFGVLNYFVSQKDEAYRLLRLEEEKSERLLLNVLPKEIAGVLKQEQRTIADQFDEASILFADLVGFTSLTAQMPPVETVNLLNEVFSYFDSLVEKYGLEKIRTIGDNYMVVSGVPAPVTDHAHRLACMALDIQAFLRQRQRTSGFPLQFRVGINSGPVIGGVIGRRKFVYDVWGDAVNIASRMESQGVPGKIQVTQTTYKLLECDFVCEQRGPLHIKGIGEMNTWFLIGRKK